MPKVYKESSSAFLARIVEKFPNNFRNDNSVLLCLQCETKINATQIFQVKQHLATQKHVQATQRKEKRESLNQTLVTQFQSKPGSKLNYFSARLTKTFLRAGLPLYKINHPDIQKFLEEFTSFVPPTDSALRKNYVPNLYQECLEKLRKKAANNYIWATLDETTDSQQRYVANFMFGVLGVKEEEGRSYLFAMDTLEKTNSNTIATFFNESLNSLYPNGMLNLILSQVHNMINLIFYL